MRSWAGAETAGCSAKAAFEKRCLVEAWDSHRARPRSSNISAFRSWRELTLFCRFSLFIFNLFNKFIFVLLEHGNQVSRLTAQIHIVLQGVTQKRSHGVTQLGVNLLNQALLFGLNFLGHFGFELSFMFSDLLADAAHLGLSLGPQTGEFVAVALHLIGHDFGSQPINQIPNVLG